MHESRNIVKELQEGMLVYIALNYDSSSDIPYIAQVEESHPT